MLLPFIEKKGALKSRSQIEKEVSSVINECSDKTMLSQRILAIVDNAVNSLYFFAKSDEKFLAKCLRDRIRSGILLDPDGLSKDLADTALRYFEGNALVWWHDEKLYSKGMQERELKEPRTSPCCDVPK